MAAPLKDLGWANKGGETYRIIQEHLERCRTLGHQQTDIDVGPPMRGIEHVVTCRECGFVYRYDSSD